MIYSLFPTAVGVYDIQIPDHVNEDYFRSLNISGYHSLVTTGESSHDTVKGNMFLLNEKELEPLKFQIQNAIDHYTSEVGLQALKITSSWFNIMEPGGETLPHQHKASTISGALYVKSEPETCPFILQNPMDDLKLLDIKQQDTQFTSRTGVIDSITGRLILFPSYIIHRTTENKSKDNRVVISFNTLPTQMIINNAQVV
jgi:uncharacterized protein (TIGR02466 family)